MAQEEGGEKPPTHPDDEKKALGTGLALARIEAGFTQPAAAKELGIVKQTISSWENGRNLPDALWLRRLARLYETTTDSLVGLTPLSVAAVRFASQYDALSKAQRDKFDGMWTSYLKGIEAGRGEEAAPVPPPKKAPEEIGQR